MKSSHMTKALIAGINMEEWFMQSEILKMLEKKMIFFVLYKDQFVYMNAFFEKRLGYTKEELIHRRFEDFVDEDFKDIFKEHRNNGEFHPTKIYKKSGEEIWLDASVKRVKVKEKEMMMVVACEITEFVEMKEKLKIKEEKYYDILNTQTELIVRTTMDHIYVFVNDGYCDYFGIQRENLIGKKKFSHIFKKDYKKIEEALGLATIENPFINVEARGIRRDGTLAWIEWTGCVFYNELGQAVEYQGVGRDITEKKKAEEQLKKLQNELEIEIEKRTSQLNKVNKELTLINSYMNSILMHMSEGVVVVDELGNIKKLNWVLDKKWNPCIKEIKEYLKMIILEGKNNDIYQMLKEKKSFYGSELTIPTAKGNLQFFISGDPIDNFEDHVNRGVIVFRPIQQIHELVNRFSGAQARFKFCDIITQDKKMLQTVELAARAALGEGSILIQGESGTGKELFAQAIHNHSRRVSGPFVAVNCGAIPRDLIGSELFGYEEGAFTGAKRGGKPGKFELAKGGTLFLDEIGDMPFEQQVALLRVIQEKKIMRIGGEQEIPIDVRIICATNKNLLEAIKDGRFRKDLYYRLNVISIKISPLRERRGDILLLFKYFIKQTAKNGDKLLENIDPLVIEYLTKYNWYGNVRELQNVVERIIHIVTDEHIEVAHLPDNILKTRVPSIDKIVSMSEQGITIKDIVEEKKKIQEEQEANKILKLFKEHKGNISQIARAMDISRSTLYRKMKKYKIEKGV
ncbi:sigma 54-interacting transcriptional regulator [Crassaminicella profunda]|uniref:sigma 54-interacting transcriptional regulator n=1 Tax=Crassaminicella profunda TaxID=1286698 RepID=UPI001CA71C99|nr:sigma 54-interacting transcriptional regulator [Crassaminicella profunda]QZY54805.1 sigma 54-interacting transcriptional regulator [Crassaminicella profunda]